MSLFRSIAFTSVLVGLIAGPAITAVQAFGTSRLIAQAEVYERAGEGHHHEAAVADSPISGHAASEHEHEEGGWQPSDGFERTAFTLAANILTSIGYSLVLVGLIALCGRTPTWREGLGWGIAAFACVMLAPMLGLPPELPGTPSAPLAERQLWWIATVVSTAVAIALVIFQRKPWTVALAMLVVAAPHLVGAPQAPEGSHGLAPAALERQFVAMAALTSLLLWIMIGSLGATFFRRMESR
ncbi:CbtA family protein (plasmid) [Rhizobium sp. CB3060]|uniref:CbtA family protein n=1 Tax=Rhizobium sp. CB3060 TaxID=3138255 RepID=UPI0021A51CC3|nr:CbtA family protein [Rhizobium tropici]UWU26054.1 CbtA family protein [Rhizobium tropici]